MTKPEHKYIQETDWWIKSRKKTETELLQQWDDMFIECVEGRNSNLSKERK